MKILHYVTFGLLVVGGLNWLAVAFNYNLVDMVLGAGSTLSMVVYILVGVSAIFEAATHKSNCKNCTSSPSGQM